MLVWSAGSKKRDGVALDMDMDMVRSSEVRGGGICKMRLVLSATLDLGYYRRAIVVPNERLSP